eukprot:TRINITY_DN93631_c0_g1_i1.p3 TRINITY_DN93631_c0_g1~~TRINITY_DN93631_c0_g1_i1.p3  ORF type:complete len:102 (+),score=12.15 TRINITY_DN93631_c0_g1_i1:546-851(+)
MQEEQWCTARRYSLEPEQNAPPPTPSPVETAMAFHGSPPTARQQASESSPPVTLTVSPTTSTNTLSQGPKAQKSWFGRKWEWVAGKFSSGHRSTHSTAYTL